MALLLVVGSAILAGCETNVDPFIEDDRFYTIFGYLDTATELQAVRVIPLRRVIGQNSSEIDAIVTTTELESGSVVEWTAELVDFPDGSVGHVFRGPFRPNPGSTYRFDILRSDGASASASTTIPVATSVSVAAPILAVASAFQNVFWSDIPTDPFRVDVWYRFMGVRPSDPFVDAVIVYGEEVFGGPKNGGWETLVRLSEDREKVTEAIGVAGNAGLTLMGVGARLTLPDDAWRAPGGVYDKELLVQPGAFSNVENGFGFLGSVNQYTVEWGLSPEITKRIGYSVPSVVSD